MQEDKLLITGPGLYVRCLGFEILALPLLGELVAHVGKRRVKLGLGWQACVVEPALPVYRGNLVFQTSILGLAEEVQVGLLELVLVEGFPGPLCEVEGDELVKSLAADYTLKVPDEVESLLIGD